MQGAPAGPFAGTQAPATCDVRGAAPPREQVVRLGSCSPPMGAPPHAPGDFPVAGKVTKGAPRAAPFGIPRCVVTALFALAAHRAGLPSATKIDRFATLGWWANRSLFLLKLHRGHTLNCQSVARQVGFLEDAAGLFTLNQYRQDRGPGDQRGLRPLRRGSRLLRILEPGGPWRIFRSIYAASFLYARK